MNQTVKRSYLSGSLIVPPSKSDAQRSILCAAFSHGSSIIRNYGQSKDVLAMLNNVAKLGAKLFYSEDGVRIEGTNEFPNNVELNIGESGLGLRLMAGVCANHQGTQILTGEGSILKRDQSFFEKYFPLNGVEVDLNNGKLPLEIKGQFGGSEIIVDGSESSQYISGLLMGLPLLETSSVLHVENSKSTPYISMTLDTLQKFGIEIVNENFQSYQIKGGQNYTPCKYAVESDWSSASYWLVASAIGNPIGLNGLSMQSKQADIKILEAFENANCIIQREKDEIQIDGLLRRAFSFDATDCPDLFPALVTFAVFCEGVTTLKGVSRLSNKESDRGVVLQKEFGKLGVRIEINDDVMSVFGGGELNGNTLSSHNDHRIAMCLAIAATKIEEEILIEGAESVSKSYPEFWEHLEMLTAG